jgi:hypothetical protein
MKKNKKTAHTKEELITIFKDKDVPETLFPRFLSRYKFYFDELYDDMKNYEDDDFDEGDSIQESALYVLNLYTTPFLELIKKGHSEEWALLVSKTIEDNEIRIYDAYEELKIKQPELAEKELSLHCNNLSNDEDFKRHYLFLFSIGEGIDKPFKKATEYAKGYKQQIRKGKSKIYAHEYADLAAENLYHNIYCEEYAYAYEKGINEGKNEKYSRTFANKYGDEITNIKARYGGNEDEEALDFTIEKVNAYMKAWEYVTNNKLDVTERFYEIYENIHLNTYYADDGMPDGTTKEIDKEILEKVLIKYKK